jgi:hypothetical protein
MATHLHHLPDFIYQHSGWFFFMSNELEMDRIRAATQARAIEAARQQMVASQARQGMRRRARLGR